MKRTQCVNRNLSRDSAVSSDINSNCVIALFLWQEEVAYFPCCACKGFSLSGHRLSVLGNSRFIKLSVYTKISFLHLCKYKFAIVYDLLIKHLCFGLQYFSSYSVAFLVVNCTAVCKLKLQCISFLPICSGITFIHRCSNSLEI